MLGKTLSVSRIVDLIVADMVGVGCEYEVQGGSDFVDLGSSLE